MADLDVSDVLDDPDFNVTFGLIRSTAVVGENGMNAVATVTPASAVGVVQPAGARDLDRLPDLSRQSGTIQVWTRFVLNLDAASILASDGVTIVTSATVADKIAWNGSIYTVMACDPWLYGSGYWRSLASMETLS